MITNGCRDRCQQTHIDLGVRHVGAGVLRAGADRPAYGVDLTAESVGQDRLELGKRAGTGLFDAGNSGGCGETDGDRHRLLVVEQQRRQLGADAELVVPVPAAYGIDRIVEAAQPLYVIAHRPRADPEPLRELTAGPDGAGLEQSEQSQQSRRTFLHHFSIMPI
jgi:hypothetical protein